MSEAKDQNPGDDSSASLRPETASVLALLASRGIEIPGLQRGGEPSADAAPDTSAGDPPRYTVLEQVGRGGMGVVLRVRDEDLRRELAMKVLDRADRAGGEHASAPRDLGRFLEEAQVTGQLDHPGVPPIHELGLGADGRLFFTMKLVRGGTFGDVIADVQAGREGWTTTRALGVVLKVCEALAYAHHKGVIHRDIKPANIMVGRFGETHVMDWGLAKVLEGAGDDASRATYDSIVSRSIVHTDRREAAVGDGSSQATLDGDVVGTPAYMAPEQARGQLEALGPTSDIYAVGALLYHLLAGQAPYIEPGVRVSPHTVLRWVIDGPPKPLASLAPTAPPELLAIIEKAMHREPGLRYTSMLDLAADLQAFIEDRVVRAYQTGAWAEARKWVVRNKPLAAAAALLLLVTLGALGAVSWVQAAGRAEVEERNALLGESNAALADANTRLADTNDALGSANAQLAETNALVEHKNTELEQTNAALAAESYAANMTAAVAALEAGGGAAARRHLAACPEELRGWDWRHLSLRADPSLEVWPPEASLLWDVEHSADGRRIATACGPLDNYGPPTKQVRVLDADTGATLLTLPSEETVAKVAFSPDGRRLAWADTQYVNLWDFDLERERRGQVWIDAECMELRFLDDARLLVLSTDNNAELSTLRIWNVSEQRMEYERTSRPAMTAAVPSPDGARLAVGRSDGSVELLALPGGATLWKSAPVRAADEHRVFNIDLPGVSGLDFARDGTRLAVAEREGRVRLLDARDGSELAAHVLAAGVAAYSPRFHPDGPWIVLGDASGSVRFLDAWSLDEIERLSGHDLSVRAVSISPDGNRIVSGDVRGGLRVWDGRPGAASLVVHNRAAIGDTGFTQWQRTLEFSPDGRLVAWTPSPRGISVTDAVTGVTLYRLVDIDSAVSGAGFSPDGSLLHVQSEVEGLSTFSVVDGRLLETQPLNGYRNWTVFDPSSQLLASSRGNAEDETELFITAGAVLAGRFTGHTDTASRGVFTADSQRLLTCGWDGALRMWDLRSGSSEVLVDSDDTFQWVALTRDGGRALSTELDPTRSGLSIWDLTSGERLAYHPASDVMLRGDLHPDETLWAGSGANGSVSLWSLERGEMFSLRASDYGVTHTRFDPAGTRLAALDRAGTLYLWDTVHPRERSAARREASKLARFAGAARRVVDEMLEEHLFMDRVVAALEVDTRLAPDLRAAALREMHVRGDNARWVWERVWKRVLPADRELVELMDDPAYLAQVEASLPDLRALRDRWRGYQDAWEPLIFALWLLGHAEDAQAMTEVAIETEYSFNPRGPLATLALSALTSHAQDDHAMARLFARDARDFLERARYASPEEQLDLEVTARLLELAEVLVDGG